MGRLFTFGCSFTNYYWQTWADIIGNQFVRYENWGKAGAGNYYITSRLYECNSVNKIECDDVVLIMFSSVDRFDFIDQTSEYVTMGSVYGEHHRLGRKFVINEWSEEFGLYNTWFCVKSAKQLLDSIGCKYVLMKGFDFNMTDGKNSKFEKPKNVYTKYSNCIEELGYIVKGESLNSFHQTMKLHYEFDDLPNKIEGHPTIKVYLEWVKKYLPEFYNEEMDLICNQWESQLPKTIKEINLKRTPKTYHGFGNKII